MTGQVYHFSTDNERSVEKVIRDENIHYIHMTFGAGEGLPEHTTNAVVYMTVLRGSLRLALGGGEPDEHQGGTVIKIPQGTLMNAVNAGSGPLEMIVVKAPAPLA
jgi:quercetin dioxygenase-like cupin family protein